MIINRMYAFLLVALVGGLLAMTWRSHHWHTLLLQEREIAAQELANQSHNVRQQEREIFIATQKIKEVEHANQTMAADRRRALLERVRQQPADTLPTTAPNACTDTPSPGTDPAIIHGSAGDNPVAFGLTRERANQLVDEAWRADQLRLALGSCHAAYEHARQALADGLGAH